MTIDELEKRIRLLQAEIAAVRINSAGGGADPAELQKIWDELNTLNTDFLALQNQVDNVDTKARNAARLAKSAYDRANSVYDLAEVAQEDAQTALTRAATLDASKVGKTTNAYQLYGNDESGISGNRIFFSYEPETSADSIFLPAYRNNGIIKVGDPVAGNDCATKDYVDDNVKRIYKHNINVSRKNGDVLGVLMIYSTSNAGITPGTLPIGRYVMAPYTNGDRWCCTIERVIDTLYLGFVSLIQSGSDIGVVFESRPIAKFIFDDTIFEV